MRHLSFIFLLLFFNQCLAYKINGKKMEEVVIIVNNIEYHILKFKGTWVEVVNGKSWMKLEIINKADSLITFDISDFDAIDPDGFQINVVLCDTHPGNYIKNYPDDMLMLTNEERALVLISNKIKKLRPGARLQLGLYFDRSIEFSKNKPFIFYHSKDKIAEIFK